MTSRRAVLRSLAGSVAVVGGCLQRRQRGDATGGDGVATPQESFRPTDPGGQPDPAYLDPPEAITPVPAGNDEGEVRGDDPGSVQLSPSDFRPSLVVEDHVGGRSYVRGYDARSVQITLTGDPPIEYDPCTLYLATYRYPRKELVAYGATEPIRPPDDGDERSVNVAVTEGRPPGNEPLHHVVFALPADTGIEGAVPREYTFVYETDPFTIASDENLTRARLDALVEPASGPGFVRRSVEGAYVLTLSGTTRGRSWSVNYFIWKSAHARGVRTPRGRSYAEYVELARANGYAGDLATILAREAERNGFRNKRGKVAFVVDFVQGLPYVPDDVTHDIDDYAKRLIETVVDVSGDCEDTSILLASLLGAEPFGYDVVVVRFPDHVGVGLYGTDRSGYHWEREGRNYYYVETTGSDWGIGDLPAPYRDEPAVVHPV